MPSYWISVDGTTKKISQRRYFRLDAQLPADSTIRLKIDGIHTWLVNSHTITLTTN